MAFDACEFDVSCVHCFVLVLSILRESDSALAQDVPMYVVLASTNHFSDALDG
jgi:hypothetical protein